MPEASNVQPLDSANPGDLNRFRELRCLRNHWSRPIGLPAYYWYLTFENSSVLHSLVRRCQLDIAFPYYDLTPASELHMTLDRIAFDGDITGDQLTAVEEFSMCAFREVPPLEIIIGSLGGTRSAVGFAASPAQPIRDLRDTLRRTTLSVYPKAPINGSELHPHVTIAYCNSDDVPAGDAIAAVERLNATAPVRLTVKEAVMVLVQRSQRSYEWRAVSRIQLLGGVR